MATQAHKREKSSSSKSSRAIPIERLIHDEVGNAINAYFFRVKFLETYTKRLEDIDKEFNKIIQVAFAESNRVHRTTKFLYFTGFLLAALTLLVGLYLIVFHNQNRELVNPALGCIIGGIIATVYLQNRNPAKNLDIWAKHLSALTYIYLGYIHQLHQIDAAFMRSFSEKAEIEPAKFDDMLQQIQDITDEAMGKIVHILNKTDD